MQIKKIMQAGRSAVISVSRRAAGDTARDRLDWKTAETEYRLHLNKEPDDQAIWVQYGHCLKEQGKLEEAEAAYEHAVELKPNDPDAHLQLGHVSKLLNKFSVAEQAYRTSLELQPSKAAHDELLGLSSTQDIEYIVKSYSAHDSSDTIYLEIDDLLDYLRNHKTLSGIQRVQVGIVQYALDRAEDDAERIAFVRTGKHASGFWRFQPSDLTRILKYLGEPTVSQKNLLSLIESAEQHASHVEPVAGQTYFVLGAFWGFGSNAARYTKLKMAGVSVGVYIYDLIPITHPEYCTAGLVSEFSFALGDGLYAFDFIFTISDFVAQDVRRFQKRHNLRLAPVSAVLLAHQLHDRPAIGNDPIWSSAIAPLKQRPFVLMVSTIEARKNHTYLYSVWKTLLDEGLDPPDLVFVGRFGWRVNDLRDMLQGTGFLGGRIHVLHDLSDVDLESLYKACLFTAFPSVIEGWGLPVGESLAHGKPCVASNTSSIPEVGGELVDYIDPWNLRGGVAVFRKMIFDESYREARAKKIRNEFVARTWNDVGRDLLDELKNRSTLAVGKYSPPRLAAGEILQPGAMSIGTTVPENYPSRPLRPIFAESWYPAEAFGCWLRGNEGSLWFSTNCTPGIEISVYVHMCGAPWSTDHTVRLQVGENRQKQPVRKSFPTSVRSDNEQFTVKADFGLICRTKGVVEPDGTVFLRFFVDGPIVTHHSGKNSADDRVFNVGLVKIAYAELTDAQLRVDLIEHFSVLN